jgi:hypothetical protein
MNERLDEMGFRADESLGMIEDLQRWTGFESLDVHEDIPTQLEVLKSILDGTHDSEDPDAESEDTRPGSSKRRRTKTVETHQLLTVDSILQNSEFEDKLNEMIAAAVERQNPRMQPYPIPPPQVSRSDIRPVPDDVASTSPDDVRRRLEQLEQLVQRMQNPFPNYVDRSASTIPNAMFG